jgi:IMP dehydrogenase
MAKAATKFLGEGLTYDDVLLVPSYSEVLPREVDISSQFTRNIKINAPIVSAAMDTVTESALAIAIAQEGGIGVLHKNMSIDAQAAEVRKVKRSESGMIQDPITLHEDATIGEALNIMRENRIGGIPIVNDSGILVGILTNRDLRFERIMQRKVSEVMTKEHLVTVTGVTNLQKAEVILMEYKIEKLPVIDKKRKLIGLITYKDIIKFKSRPDSCKDSFGRLRVAAAVGITADMLQRVEALVKSGR